MKKIFLSALFAAIVFSTAVQSQETIDWHWPNYYFNDIPVIEGMEYPEFYYLPDRYYYNRTDVFTELRKADTQITVYGIAISSLLFPSPYFEQMFVLDTSHSGWHEYARLYKPIGDSMVLLGEGQYNMFDQPSVYLPTNKHERVLDSSNYRYTDTVVVYTIPVFEAYFDSAVTVADSFYIGSTHFNTTTPDETGYYYLRYPSWIARLRYGDNNYRDTIKLHVQMDSDSVACWYRYCGMTNSGNYTLVCYPILTPNPYPDTTHNDTIHIDTTQVDTTQNAIATARLLERYVNVYPTVTDGGAVTVMSSFHLESVEVYDAAGRMVSRQPAKGIAATVDTSQLPSGTYMLRIKTVSGTTTKRFLKR